MKKITKLCFAIMAAFLFSQISLAQEYILVPAPIRMETTPCEHLASSIALAIKEAQAQRKAPERTERYQALRRNPQYNNFRIPQLLSEAMDLELNGASFRDLSDSIRISCNKQSNGY